MARRVAALLLPLLLPPGIMWEATTAESCLERMAGDNGDPTKPVVSSVLGRPIVLEIDNWPSQRLLTVATQILLTDKFGLNVTLSEQPGGADLYERAARTGGDGDDGVDANMEVWPDSKREARARWLCNSTCGAVSLHEQNCVVESSHSALGESTMSVTVRDPAALVGQLPTNFWRSYKTQRLLDVMPSAGFDLFEGVDAPESAAIECELDYCSPDGNFYPYACAADGQWTGDDTSPDQFGAQSDLAQAEALGCRAFFAMSPLWDPSVFERAIDGRDLKLAVQYVGTDESQLMATIEAALDRGADAVAHYSWTPSFIAANQGTQTIFLPDRAPIHLTKIVNTQLQMQSPGAFSLIQQFSLTDQQIFALLDLHPDSPAGGGKATEEEAACEWLRTHESVWQPWIDRAYSDSLVKLNVSVGALFGLDDEWDRIEYRAAQIALQHVNADDTLLQSINLQLAHVDISAHRELRDVNAGYGRDEALDIASKLQSFEAVASIGAGWSSDVEGLSPAVHNAEHALLSQSATASFLSNTTLYPGFRRLCPPDSGQASAIAATIRRFGFQRVVIIYCDDSYCTGLRQNVVEHLVASGITPISYPLVTLNDGETVPGTFMKRIQDALDHCEAGCAPGGCGGASDADTVAIIAAVRDVDYLPLMKAAKGTKLFRSATWIGGDSVGANDRAEVPPAMMAVVPAVNQSTRMFYDLKREYPEVEDDIPYSLFAYDAVWTIARAIDFAVTRGGANIHSPTIGRDIIAALRQLPRFDGATGTVLFDEHGDRIGGYELLIAEDAAWAPLGKVSPQSPTELELLSWWENSQVENKTDLQIPFCPTRNAPDPEVDEAADASDEPDALLIVLVIVAAVFVLAVAAISIVYRTRLRSASEQAQSEATDEAIRDVERLAMTRSSNRAEVQRSQPVQKPVSQRPHCYIPTLRAECTASQLCTKCGAIGQGRLDWEELPLLTTAMDDNDVSVTLFATPDRGVGGSSSSSSGSGGGGLQGDKGGEGGKDEPHLKDDAVDDDGDGGDGSVDLLPGTGSQRFFCHSCWR